MSGQFVTVKWDLKDNHKQTINELKIFLELCGYKCNFYYIEDNTDVVITVHTKEKIYSVGTISSIYFNEKWNCRYNINLFKFLTLYDEENHRGQLFVNRYEDGEEEFFECITDNVRDCLWWKDYETDKPTKPEIMNHFLKPM
jgi:hypothetical protein